MKDEYFYQINIVGKNIHEEWAFLAFYNQLVKVTCTKYKMLCTNVINTKCQYED